MPTKVVAEPSKKSWWNKIIIALFAIGLFVWLLGVFADTYFLWLWFKELNLTVLFWKPITYNLMLSVPLAVIFLVLTYIGLSVSKREAVSLRPDITDYAVRIKRWIFATSVVGAGVISIIWSFRYGDLYKLLTWVHATPFNITDPIFNKDISFYIFNLPFWQKGFWILLVLIIVAALISFFYGTVVVSHMNTGAGQTKNPQNIYNGIVSSVVSIIILAVIVNMLSDFTSGWLWLIFIAFIFGSFMKVFVQIKSLSIATTTTSKTTKTKTLPTAGGSIIGRPFTALGGIAALLIGLKLIFINKYLLLTGYSSDAVPVGITQADLTIYIPYLVGFGIMMLLAGVSLWLWLGKVRYSHWITASVFSLVFLYVIGGNLVYSLYDRFVVTPNELTQQTQFIQNHITATRSAWGLDKIEEKSFEGDGTLTAQAVKDNQTTFDNLRLWNREQLLESFKQTQSLRSYYDFLDIDDDRYTIDGKYQQVMLAARELNAQNDETAGFINNSIIYTHGFGVVASPSAAVTEQGSPVLISKDIPPQGSLPIVEPRIYFGQSEDKYLLVNAQTEALDYPAGDNNVYSHYKGTAGVPIDSWWKRLLAARTFDYKLIFTNEIKEGTRLIYNTNNFDRLSRLFPFLKVDEKMQIVVDDTGKLVWLSDGYTTSDYYPYSQYQNLPQISDEDDIENIQELWGPDFNYIRNSVKMSIDAYNGTIKAYVTDDSDPIISTYSKMFPGVFQDNSSMPSTLKAHIQYPDYLFAKQAEMYATYHMQDPKTFYNLEDQWDIVMDSAQSDPNSTTNTEYLMRHLIMKLPGERKEEFVFMLPFTPKGKANLINWFTVRNDGENYGQIQSYSLPKSSLVYGPEQIKARINQDPVISQQITLWDRSGSRVVLGSVFAIPVNNAFVYVQPLYLYATAERSIPQLRGIIMAHKERIVMGTSVSDALTKLFNQKFTQTIQAQDKTQTTEPDQTSNELIKQAVSLYDKAQTAQRAGNWDQYGKYMEELKEVLQKLDK